MTNKPEYLYLHVPFCRSICSYCDFTHSVYVSQRAEQWLESLKKEIVGKEINPHLKTIYIGGGTPTALSYEQLEQVLCLLDPYASSVEEYTIEINPETFDQQKADLLARHGINRASIGMQSSDSQLLKLMNRHHSHEDVKRTIEQLKRADITNVSLDLMYSFPTQTMEMLKTSIQDAIALHPRHLSLYSLTIEDHTVLAAKGCDHLDEDTEADMYELLCTLLPEHGYHQYEVSNFCLPGYESRHNCAYWHYEDFYGIGMGASGKEDGIRYDNTDRFDRYLENPFTKEETVLSKKDQMFETIMMGIRLKQGISLSSFEERFHVPLLRTYADAIEKWEEEGMLKCEEGFLSCSENGFAIMNTILLDFLD